MKRLVASVQFLAQQSLAFRGHTSTLYDKNNGNFLKLIEMLAKFDPIMADHVNRATTTSKRHYLSNRIQNELIECMASSVLDSIISAVKESKYYAIMVDCTSDLSHVEQMSTIVRYVTLCPNENKYKIEERFVSFVESKDGTGEGIGNSITSELERVDLDVQDMLSQGYDNGANMAARFKGVQNRITELNPRAHFVPCACNKLNLMLNDTAKLIDNKRFSFFETVQKCYVFFSESPKRWEILQGFATEGKITLKNVSTTRWSSREAATKCLLFNLPKIHAALLKIANVPKPENTSYDAHNLARKIGRFNFICNLVVWHNILSRINVISKMLQSQSLDIARCLELIANLTNTFNELRQNEGDDNVIDEWFETAKQIRNKLNFEPTALDYMAIQERLAQRAEMDELEVDNIAEFKASYVYPILDVALIKLEDRFKHLNEVETVFGFLFNLHFTDISLSHCQRLETKLTSTKDGSKDVDAEQLLDEIRSFQALISNGGEKSPLDFLNKIRACCLVPIYPNLTTALKIFLTLPVTIASAESSFSKLKLIKNYLRTSMSQDRLSNLSMISIESELLDSIPQETIIEKFAAAKARQISFN
ncbi:uncharacterized protein LOC129571529 [Sitodiplosis mosellana]|uniref:uncharacterized protein LOC129571529 n=1 Tax=Sitodiplosis mosellana TaxID=263140 RepID=UPI0024447D4A|nr:uncharacterized protein LOC129571529 [Sitodiplosis mosellana]